MQKYAVFQVPAAVAGTSEPIAFTEGNAFWCVLMLLDKLTLTELHSLRMRWLHEAQKRVAKRTAAGAETRVAAEYGRLGVARPADRAAMDDVITLTDSVPPVVVDGAPDADEDGDEVSEATPLEVIDPAAGVKQQWNEDAGGPVS